MKQLSKKIKDLREVRGLSPEELADRLGFAKSTVWAYESGKKQVSVVHLERLADFFEISVDSLLDRNDRTINVDLQNANFLNEYTVMLDDQPLNEAELAEAASFIQVKRRMGSYGLAT
ncbi:MULTISPECIES: helix-turn-helix domain-containing protein [unclassified Planococcus (in: firmicutes)]|uniref:helix-turn-helix domain-containing protein n=1 Tax=Planococcus TaxID=1372 RepID=UPI000C32469C|nr:MULTISPECIES: helix-turn-helix transcriptional regulator [unclassified Planococcus (in: firmicutes)]AUD14856.1 XRE family transcriptional regulator [Planococcus sp. MB-3u-03]PKG45178.1 XRE family transcriptional regulator [Planococcus sp. Urea-trap-24]PKG87520.1 XRE family transcriptional regulator [Planococcus sp. Urea-3u-39]PKH41512.1 XRE family transcriptional regulator [Planococcus sp. MB-3u-09]